MAAFLTKHGGLSDPNHLEDLREPLIIINLLFPQMHESSDVKSFWIPAGVYPDENRGRNDIFGGSLNIHKELPEWPIP